MNALVAPETAQIATAAGDVSFLIVAVAILVTMFAQVLDAVYTGEKARDKRLWYGVLVALLSAYSFVVLGRLVEIVT